MEIHDKAPMSFNIAYSIGQNLQICKSIQIFMFFKPNKITRVRFKSNYQTTITNGSGCDERIESYIGSEIIHTLIRFKRQSHGFLFKSLKTT